MPVLNVSIFSGPPKSGIGSFGGQRSLVWPPSADVYFESSMQFFVMATLAVTSS